MWRRVVTAGRGRVRPVGASLENAVGGAPLPGDEAAWPAQADPPCSLAYLQLAEAGRTQLGDQRRQQLTRQTIDGRVICGALGRIALGMGVA
jgi:hypothetical protein